jgi:AraC family transcriptional regulator
VDATRAGVAPEHKRRLECSSGGGQTCATLRGSSRARTRFHGLHTLVSRLDAHRHLRATMLSDSFEAGWRALLLRAYKDAPEAQFTTPPTMDHLIVLVTEGSCEIEGNFRGKWHGAAYRAGTIAMTAPGEEVTLRWQGTTRHSTLQVHIPAATIRGALEQLAPDNPQVKLLPHGISYDDPLIRSVVLNLADAMRSGAPDIYAESAAEYLAAHMVLRYGGRTPPRLSSRDFPRVRRVRDYMQANLSTDLSLEVLAGLAYMSRFHLIRVFRQAYGETPLRFLTRLRMEHACQRLVRGSDPVAIIASDCGYPNPTHFAAAFPSFCRSDAHSLSGTAGQRFNAGQFGDRRQQFCGSDLSSSRLASAPTELGETL